jgi:2-haloacid dehalogenase
MTVAPSVIVFDVNETLSDMKPLGEAFARFGMPESTARLWFTEILRDGFALTAAGNNPAFAEIATDILRRFIARGDGTGDVEEKVAHIMDAFMGMSLHPDAAPGLKELGRIAQLVTLANGAASAADSLLTRGGVRDEFSRLLSVQDAPLWKPARKAYEYAAGELGEPVNRLLLVAAHPWDIHGANAAGLHTAWINRAGAAYPSYFSPPTIEAEDLVALAATLAAA